jgi:uncharacterized membrane protein YdbT with pleckstrin-like domain
LPPDAGTTGVTPATVDLRVAGMARSGSIEKGGKDMDIKYFNPNPKYLVKMRLIMFLIALLIMICGVLFGWLIGLDEGPRVGANVTWGFLLGDLLWWIPAMILAGFYFRSLKYEIRDDEVIVHAGIWTKSVKHVPYRTVTNLKVKRDIFDRWFFGIGSLNIQTAGMSGSTGAEESLVGLDNVHEVYDIVAEKLRKFRGGMAPTAAGGEEETVLDPGGVMAELLREVRAIRQAQEKK